MRKAKEEEERLKKAKEEEERKRKEKEEEERKKKEEEEAKNKKGAKPDPKKKDGKAEAEKPVEEHVEETEEVKLEREKKEVRDKIEAVKNKIDQYLGKIKLCKEEQDRVEAETGRKKVTDLVEKSSGDRKFLKAGSRDYANTVLVERKSYILVELKKNPDDDHAEEEP